jgi:hypothetical protein
MRCIRRKIKNLPPISPEALIPRNQEEAGLLRFASEENMKKTGCQPEDFIAYFVNYHVKGHKVNCRAVGIRQLRKP